MALKFLYTLFIGLLLAAFVGIGIATFYVAPKSPDYPRALSEPKIGPTGVSSLTPEEQVAQQKQQAEYDQQQKTYQTQANTYERNVSVLAILAAILILILALTLARHILVIADGLLLGGILTLFYAIIRGFSSDDLKFRFIVVTIGLGVTLLLGYLKFVKPDETKK